MNGVALPLRGMAALLLVTGAIIHGLGFPKAVAALLASAPTAFLVGSFKVLWLADSATLATVGVLAAYLVARPSAAAPIVIVLASIPVALTGMMSIIWMPGFFAGPVLLVSAGMLAASAAGGR